MIPVSTTSLPLRNESLYLMYRRFFPMMRKELRPVSSAEEMRDHIARRVTETDGKIGIMLSGGMDSVMLAKFLPEGSIAYTLTYCEGEADLNEFDQAARFVPPGVEHKRVYVSRDAFFDTARELTHLKREPTVPHDPAIGITARAALEDGVTHMVTGVGADAKFGGFAHFYREPTYADVRKAIIKQFVAPWHVLHTPAPVDWVLGHYTVNDRVDVQGFLTEVGTEGTAVFDSLQACGLVAMNLYGEMRFADPLDIKGRGGKYPLTELFSLLYPDCKPNKKVPLPVPYGSWMKDYVPHRPEFRTDRLHYFGGKRKYQIYALELYMDLRDQFGWPTPNGDRLFFC